MGADESATKHSQILSLLGGQWRRLCGIYLPQQASQNQESDKLQLVYSLSSTIEFASICTVTISLVFSQACSWWVL